MFTNGVPLAKNDDKNDFKSLKLTHRNDSDSSESSETIYVNRQDNGDDHKHLSKRAAFTTDQRKFQNDMLYAHNYYRSYYCAQALQLDDTLSRSAQNFAEKLAYANQFYHSGTQGVGENLYMASGMTINGKSSSNH
ncbi:unnamed protein product [Rotaria sp. Silwood2]|nr:unnamed protein product [Rotaria sp. Silwood2]